MPVATAAYTAVQPACVVDATYTGVGPVYATNRCLIFRPRITPPNGSDVILWSHGLLADRHQAQTSAGMAEGIGRMCALGYTVIAMDGAQNGSYDEWGNDLDVANIEGYRAWAATQPGLNADRVVLWGISMGGYRSLRYALRYPARTRCVIGDVPVASLYDFQAAGSGGGATDCARAWGLASTSVPIPPAGRLLGGRLEGLPFLAYTSSADTTALPSWTAALCDDIGPTARQVDLGTGGHGGTPSGGSLDFDRLSSFIGGHR